MCLPSGRHIFYNSKTMLTPTSRTGSVSTTRTCALEGYNTTSVDTGAAVAAPARHHNSNANSNKRLRMTTSL